MRLKFIPLAIAVTAVAAVAAAQQKPAAKPAASAPTITVYKTPT